MFPHTSILDREPHPCATAQAKTPGQIAFETDLAACPTYHDGTPRRSWDQLSDPIRKNWERNPTPRRHKPKTYPFDGVTLHLDGKTIHGVATVVSVPCLRLPSRPDPYRNFSDVDLVGTICPDNYNGAMSWRTFIAVTDARLVGDASLLPVDDAVHFANCCVAAGVVFA